MNLHLQEITKDNFIECIRLRVRDDQRYVASNVFSIAQSKVEPKWKPLAVYDRQTMVGFVMFELDYQNKKLYLCRFMIDERHQRKGYGKATLDILREMAMQDPQIMEIELSTRPDNEYGIKFYENFGFKDTGILDEGEKVFVLKL